MFISMLEEPQKSSFLVARHLGPYPSSLVVIFLLELQKKLFFLVARPLPPPLSGRATKKNFFAASPSEFWMFLQVVVCMALQFGRTGMWSVCLAPPQINGWIDGLADRKCSWVARGIKTFTQKCRSVLSVYLREGGGLAFFCVGVFLCYLQAQRIIITLSKFPHPTINCWEGVIYNLHP